MIDTDNLIPEKGFISKNIVMVDGKPRFTGKDEEIVLDKTVCPLCHKVFEFRRETTVKCPHCKNIISESSKTECPVCHGQFDYLVGDDTPNGGIRGCETCWKPSIK